MMKYKTSAFVLWNTAYNFCAVGLYFGPALALRAFALYIVSKNTSGKVLLRIKKMLGSPQGVFDKTA